VNKLHWLSEMRIKSVKVRVDRNRTPAFRKQVSDGTSHRSDKMCVWHLSRSWGASLCLTLHWPVDGGQRSLRSWVQHCRNTNMQKWHKQLSPSAKETGQWSWPRTCIWSRY